MEKDRLKDGSGAEGTVERLLVVDDDRSCREAIRELLEDAGHAVDCAEDGEQAVRLFVERNASCVLLDITMPGLGGIETCRRIRRLRTDVPILFLTARHDVGTFDEAIRAGANDFLTKPIELSELSLRVDAALRLRRLDSELREYCALVERQRADLVRLQLQKERLTAFVVHDLKNPVNGIDLQVQLLARQADDPVATRRTALRIRDEVKTLTRLILNLLDISRGVDGHFRVEPVSVSLPALLDGVLKTLEVRAAVRHVNLEGECAVEEIRADEAILARVLENLVDNAIRHAPEHTTVHVTARREGRQTILEVADQGPGVPAFLRERVFERYFQVESTVAATRGGHGLGLAFCKLAIEAHGGTVRLEDGEPGAIFRVELPDSDTNGRGRTPTWRPLGKRPD